MQVDGLVGNRYRASNGCLISFLSFSFQGFHWVWLLLWSLGGLSNKVHNIVWIDQIGHSLHHSILSNNCSHIACITLHTHTPHMLTTCLLLDRVPKHIQRRSWFYYGGLFMGSFFVGMASYKQRCLDKIMSLENSRLADELREHLAKEWAPSHTHTHLHTYMFAQHKPIIRPYNLTSSPHTLISLSMSCNYQFPVCSEILHWSHSHSERYHSHLSQVQQLARRSQDWSQCWWWQCAR